MNSFAEKPVGTWIELFRSSSNAEERYRALQAIISLTGVDQSIPLLSSGLEDADSAVRAGAGRWLASQAEKSPRPGNDAEWRSIQGLWEALLDDADPDVRFEAARGLMAFEDRDDKTVGVLLALLHDEETQPLMLAAVLKTLGRVTGTNSPRQPEWQRFLSHEHAEVREQAAKAIGGWGVGSALNAALLLPLLDDEEPFVREDAAKSLGRIGVASPEVMAALKTAAGDEDEIVAAAAQAAMQQLSR